MRVQRSAAGVALLLSAMGAMGVLSAQSVARTSSVRDSRYSTWSDYGGSADSSQYSSLTQISKTNVAQLRQAWFFPVADRTGNFNPYICTKQFLKAGFLRRDIVVPCG